MKMDRDHNISSTCITIFTQVKWKEDQKAKLKILESQMIAKKGATKILTENFPIWRGDFRDKIMSGRNRKRNHRPANDEDGQRISDEAQQADQAGEIHVDEQVPLWPLHTWNHTFVAIHWKRKLVAFAANGDRRR